MIVMCTHGRGGLSRVIYRGVAEHVLHRSAVPVLFAPRAAAPGWFPTGALRFLVPLDGSAFAEEALEPAADLAQALNAQLILVRGPRSAFVADRRRSVDAGRPHQ